MGDAYTHMARDARRARAVAEWHDALHAYLSDPAAAARAAAMKAAEGADAISGYGYFSGPTDFARGAEALLEALRSGDAGAWAAFLRKIAGDDDGSGWEAFRRFKPLSPFAAKKLVFLVASGSGFRIKADPEQFLPRERIEEARDARGLSPHDLSVHLVAFGPDGESETVFVS